MDQSARRTTTDIVRHEKLYRIHLPTGKEKPSQDEDNYNCRPLLRAVVSYDYGDVRAADENINATRPEAQAKEKERR